MECKEMVVTPEMAREWLASMVTNRPPRMAVVKQYANAMLAGAWKVTHQAIAMAVGGKLIDGQHRLLAVIEANTPVRMTVAFNVDGRVFDAIDIGPRRNATDLYLLMGGQPDNSKQRVAIAAAMLGGGDNASREKRARAAVEHAEVITTVMEWFPQTDALAWMTAAAKAAYANAVIEYGRDAIEPIALEQAADLFSDANNPLKRLRDRLTAMKTSGIRMQRNDVYTLTKKAIEFRMNGEMVGKLVRPLRQPRKSPATV